MLATVLRAQAETAGTCLIEGVLATLRAATVGASHVRQHLVYARVIGGLQHDAGLRRVHLVDAERALAAVMMRASLCTLLAHAISHEESLIRLAAEHTIHPLRWRLRLSAAEVGAILVHKSVGSQRIVSHRMLVHTVRLEVAHHVGDACLSRRLRAFLVRHFTRVHVAIDLVEVLLGRRIQLTGEVLLRLQRSRLRLRDLIHLEARAHRRMHDDLTGRLYLLQTVKACHNLL